MGLRVPGFGFRVSDLGHSGVYGRVHGLEVQVVGIEGFGNFCIVSKRPFAFQGLCVVEHVVLGLTRLSSSVLRGCR